MIYKKVKISDILINNNNKRVLGLKHLDIINQQKKIIIGHVELWPNSPQKYYDMARSIAHEGIGEAPLGYEKDGKFIIEEGNRRVSAIMTLINPSLNKEFQQDIEILNVKKLKEFNNDTLINIRVALNEKEAKNIARLSNEDKNDGATKLKWNKYADVYNGADNSRPTMLLRFMIDKMKIAPKEFLQWKMSYESFSLIFSISLLDKMSIDFIRETNEVIPSDENIKKINNVYLILKNFSGELTVDKLRKNILNEIKNELFPRNDSSYPKMLMIKMKEKNIVKVNKTHKRAKESSNKFFTMSMLDEIEIGLKSREILKEILEIRETEFYTIYIMTRVFIECLADELTDSKMEDKTLKKKLIAIIQGTKMNVNSKKSSLNTIELLYQLNLAVHNPLVLKNQEQASAEIPKFSSLARELMKVRNKDE